MAQLVETSEEDSFLAIASYLGELIDEGQEEKTKLLETPGSRFVDECKQLYFGEKYVELIDTFAEKFDLVLSKASSDQDVDFCLNVTCHLVQRLPAKQATPAAEKLADALVSNPESRPEKRLLSLVTLYNVLTENPAKLATLLKLLAFGKAANLADTLLPVVKAHSDSWSKELNLSPADERTLYVACANALTGCTRKPKTAAKEANRLLSKCLATYETASASELAGSTTVAVQVLSDFLKSQDSYQFDLAENPAIRHVANDKQHAALYQLLTIYLTGSVADFQKFASSNAATFESLGITQEQALTKMRLMALTGLAHGVNEVTFENISTSLSLSPEEVEPLVVQALGKRLMEARIDQLRGVVTVSKCSSRTFGTAQWRELQAQLGGWADAVKKVKDVGKDEKNLLAKGFAELGLVSA